jgi:hypothetical protein
MSEGKIDILQLAPGDINSLCHLIGFLKDFADPEFQRRIWVEAQGPEVSSYSESMASVIEDYRIAEFGGKLGQHYGLGLRERRALAAFGIALADFNDRLRGETYSDAEIIARPDWKAIVEHAETAFLLCSPWSDTHCEDKLV